MTPPAPDGHETLDQMVNTLTLEEIEAMKRFLRDEFQMFSVESVWDEGKNRSVQVRSVNSVPPEVSNLYRLVVGAAVWFEVKNMTQMSLF